jgi:hypothetical protein
VICAARDAARTREEVAEVRLRGEVIREFLRCIPSAIA